VSATSLASATSTLTLALTLPKGLTAVSLAGTTTGTGWICSVATLTCARANTLYGGSDDPVKLVVSVASSVVVGSLGSLAATLTGGGLVSSVVADDPLTIVAKLAQTITWPTITATEYALSSLPLSAKASSGLPVTFSTTTPAVCSISAATAKLLTAGYCLIHAAQAGDASYTAAATVTQDIAVHHLAQDITFAPIAERPAASSLTLSASATSGLAVAFASATPAVCTVSASKSSLLIAGACTLQASQPGSAIYAAAPVVSRTFTVAHAEQTISWPAITATQYAATTLTLAATASSGLAVTYATTTPTICSITGVQADLKLAGYCNIVASQAGNAAYAAAAKASQDLPVHHVNQTIAFAAIATQTVGTPLNLVATATSGLAVGFASTTPAVCTVSGSTASFAAAGTCTLQATQPGNGVYNPAPAVSRSFTVKPS
jgi:hypothetical protein